jgi:hypothetical protein
LPGPTEQDSHIPYALRLIILSQRIEKLLMKRTPMIRHWIFALVLITFPISQAADSIILQLQTTNDTAVLQWRSQASLPVSGTLLQYEVEASPDLANWQRLGEFVSGRIGISEETIRHAYPQNPQNAFFRITARTALAAGEKFGDSIYGYSAEFNRYIQNLGQLPLETFLQLYNPTNEYRAAITFDPTTAAYWPAFNLDPAIHNATNSTDPRLTDFRLNEQEFALFKTNGYVVSQRLGSPSFADAFYKVFTDDLPVYITTDALLHAWHRSYVAILNEIEDTFLIERLQTILSNTLTHVDALNTEAQSTPLALGVKDADYFLAVATSLITGTTNYGRLNPPELIDSTLAAISTLKPTVLPIFGGQRKVDFSQFKVRGQYEKTVALQRYFRAMMWCALLDFQFSGSDDPLGFRQFSGAVAIDVLIERSGQRENWLQFDEVIRGFVGVPDCLNLAQLHDLISAANLAAPYDQLENVYKRLWTGDLGVQHIRSGYLYSPLTPEKMKLPRSFAMMPQRFTPDSWAFSKVVFDDVIWDYDGIPKFEDKVQRRIPSALDVAFGVFGNSQIVPEIAARIADHNGLQFRDGLPYQHNLVAVRNVIDDHQPSYWTNNIYTAWIAALRALSGPTTTPAYPQAMQTRAYAHSTLNTQLASWTQLRHDTILYVKQSSTGGILCGYPDAYVEPRPAFWQALIQLAERARDVISLMPTNGWTTDGRNTQEGLRSRRMALCDRFVAAVTMLKTISEKELADTDLSQAEIDFLGDTIEIVRAYNGGSKTYSGWYNTLFYRAPTGYEPEINEGAGQWDPVVTDVHTDVPAPIVGDPGAILHEAVGNIHMAFIAIDCAGDHPPRMFAGPVLSHYEFETEATTRKTDTEWKAELKAGNLPPPPSWTKSFLVPGTYTLPSNVN